MDLRELHQVGEGAARHPWELARLEVVAGLLARTGPRRTVLDVGCGDAFVTEALATRGEGDRLVGVDIALQAPREIAGGRGELVRELAETQLEDGEVSHVLLLDVIEHVEDDLELLQSVLASPAVADDATFLITVPMFPSLSVEHDRLLGHHRRYTRSALLDVVRRAGLTMVDDGGMFSSLLAPRLLERVLEQMLGARRQKSGISTWRAPAPVTRLVVEVLLRDVRVSERLRRRGVRLPGLSHWVIARR